jgi:hypothetical protein
VEAFAVFDDVLSLDTGMTGNDGEAVLPSTQRAVLLERQVDALSAERVCALAEKRHALSLGDVIVHGLLQTFIRPAKQRLVLGPSFPAHDRASISHTRAACKPELFELPDNLPGAERGGRLGY